MPHFRDLANELFNMQDGETLPACAPKCMVYSLAQLRSYAYPSTDKVSVLLFFSCKAAANILAARLSTVVHVLTARGLLCLAQWRSGHGPLRR
jgi:hypothetical protein